MSVATLAKLEVLVGFDDNRATKPPRPPIAYEGC